MYVGLAFLMIRGFVVVLFNMIVLILIVLCIGSNVKLYRPVGSYNTIIGIGPIHRFFAGFVAIISTRHNPGMRGTHRTSTKH